MLVLLIYYMLKRHSIENQRSCYIVTVYHLFQPPAVQMFSCLEKLGIRTKISLRVLSSYHQESGSVSVQDPYII